MAAGNAFMLFYERVPAGTVEDLENELIANGVKTVKPTPLAAGLMTPPPEFMNELHEVDRGNPGLSDSDDEDMNDITPTPTHLATPPPEDVATAIDTSPVVAAASASMANGKARRRKGRRKEQGQTAVTVQ